jgi:adenosylcobinamide-phosphate synthase
MRLELQIIAAMMLDAVLGDPRWFPHPVRFMGRLANALEAPARSLLPEGAAGAAAASIVVGVAGGLTWALITAARSIHPIVADIVAVVALYTAFAAGDLSRHARDVLAAFVRNDLDAARFRAGLMVGRDTDTLDAQGVTRATVESVAENTVDGVTAPVFYAFLFGPVGAMVYKAVNTLDSTFGYRNDRYLRFGWAAARLDDVANWVPARLTALLMPIAAWLTRNRALASWRVLWRDGGKHPSPNAGLSEAAVAGALGVQLGGVNVYQGKRVAGHLLGHPTVPLAPAHIRQAIRLMWVTDLLFASLLFGIACLIKI